MVRSDTMTICSYSRIQIVTVFVVLFIFHFAFTNYYASIALMNNNEYEIPVQKTQYDYIPIRNSKVAWAIPVGGMTKRVHLLDKLLNDLLTQGAGKQNIYIFEDNGSRKFISDPDLERKANEYGVQLLKSNIKRNIPNADTPKNFGLYLALHYKYMMDSILIERKSLHDYVVIIEDDLVLAPDTVKYFTEMKKVMDVDDSIYCVSAHTDNAFPTLSSEKNVLKTKIMKPLNFDFRRGEHFMAPGFMISRILYRDYLRPSWFDNNNNLKYQDEFGMGNANWDMYMEVRISQMECIFPEIPRVSHQGGGGFTVSKEQQMQLFGNLQLSKADPNDVDYGDVLRLKKDRYNDDIITFILDSHIVYDIRDVNKYRNSKIVLLIPASHASHNAWHNLFYGYWKVTAIGGHSGHGKQRGIHQGTVFVRWLGNEVLVIGNYSPFLKHPKILQKISTSTLTYDNNDNNNKDITYLGCYIDNMNRDLPYSVQVPNQLTPELCVLACAREGFPFAGIQMGEECWCGEHYGTHGQGDDNTCSRLCGNDNQPCGGAFRNSVYELKNKNMNEYIVPFTTHPDDILNGLEIGLAQGGESCTNMCKRNEKQCDIDLLPLLTDNRYLKQVGCQSSSPTFSNEFLFATPIMTNQDTCFITSEKYMSCDYKTTSNIYRRICPCVNE